MCSKAARRRPPPHRELKEINAQLVFAKSQPLTLGVEFELALIDKESLKPRPSAPR